MTGYLKASPVAQVVAAGIGAAMFFVLGRFLVIPTPVPNTTINLQYALLAVFAFLYGPVVGLLMGLIGHFLIDVTSFGPWWSWILTSAVVGLVLGLCYLGLKADKNPSTGKVLLVFNLGAVAANAIGWMLVAPTLDILIYAEPASKVFLQGLVAGASNIVTSCVIGSIVIIAYLKTRVKAGSLKVEDE